MTYAFQSLLQLPVFSPPSPWLPPEPPLLTVTSLPRDLIYTLATEVTRRLISEQIIPRPVPGAQTLLGAFRPLLPSRRLHLGVSKAPRFWHVHTAP